MVTLIVVLDLEHYTDGARLRTLLCGINCSNATIDGVRLRMILG